jgi:hypothetical protein
MFDYLDLDAPGASTVSPAQPLPPHPGTPSPGSRPPHPERVRHLLYGSLAGIDRTIKILHALGYADPNDWSDPLPVPPSTPEPRPLNSAETWMVILTKTLFLE